MTSTPTPLISGDGDDHQALAHGVAAQVADLPHPPRLLGLGEPTHGEDEFLRLRNAVFAALVDRAGYTSIALESSAWHGRAVDSYVRGGAGVEDDVMSTGFTHGFGGSPANRALVRWLREQNRHRPPSARLRFAAFDAPVEMAAAPSPRPALRVLHDFLRARGEVGLPPWETVDRLLGPDAPWEDPAAAMDPARSIGGESRVRDLRAVTDDLRWALNGAAPDLPHQDPDDVEAAFLAGRTAAGLLAYHAAMARDTDDRWQRLAALRDTMMADNLLAVADRGPALVFAHNEHLRRGTAAMSLGPSRLRWQPAGAHLAHRLGGDYRVIACAVGEAAHSDIAVPEPDSVEGVLHRGLPPGNHLLDASALRALRAGRPMRSSDHRYFPIDDTLLGEVDQVLFLRTITPRVQT
jgi:erythromycin esterase-like protein